MESIIALIIAAAGLAGAYYYGKHIGKSEGMEDGIKAAAEYYAENRNRNIDADPDCQWH